MRMFNRTDNQGNKFLIPEHLLQDFDNLFDAYCSAQAWPDTKYELEEEFHQAFGSFLVF